MIGYEIIVKFDELQKRIKENPTSHPTLNAEWNEFVKSLNTNDVALTIFGKSPENDKSAPIEISCNSLFGDVSWEFPFTVNLVGEFESAQFIHAKFGGKVNFTGAIFRNKPIFRSARFSKRAIFARSEFCDGADFRSVSFEDDVDFEGASFAGKSDFSGAIFEKNALFNNIDKWERSKPFFLMNNAIFNGRIEWISPVVKLPNFVNSHFPNGKNIIIKEKIEEVLERIFNVFSKQGFSIQRPFGLLLISMGLFYCFFIVYGMDNSFGNALNRTFFPLSEIKERCDSVPKWMLAVQSIINVSLLFLLALGIRNKFKIK